MLHKQGELGTAVDTSLKCEALLATLCSKLQIESNGDAQVLLSKQKIVEERIETLISLKNQIYPESINDPKYIIHKVTAQMQKQNRGDLDKRIKSLVESDNRAKVYKRSIEGMLNAFIEKCGFPTVPVSGDFGGTLEEVLHAFSLFERKARMFNDVAALLEIDANWDKLGLQAARDVYRPRIADLATTHTLFPPFVQRIVALLSLQVPAQGLDVSQCGQILAQASQVITDAKAEYETVLQKNADLLKDNQAKAAAIDSIEKTASDRATAEHRQDSSPERAGTNMVSMASTEDVAELQAMLKRSEEANLAKSKEIVQLHARLEAGEGKVDLLTVDEVTTLRKKEQVEHAQTISVLEGQLSVRSEELGELKKTTMDQLKEKEDTILELKIKSKEDKRNFDADVEELKMERTKATAKVEVLTRKLNQERLKFTKSENKTNDLSTQLDEHDELIKQRRSSQQSLRLRFGQGHDNFTDIDESHQRNEELEVELRDLRAEYSEQAVQALKDREAINQLHPVVHTLRDHSSSLVQEGNDGLQAQKKVQDLEGRLKIAEKQISDHRTDKETMTETIRKLRGSIHNNTETKRLEDVIRELNEQKEREADRHDKEVAGWARDDASQREEIAALESYNKDLEEKVEASRMRLRQNLVDYNASAEKTAAMEAQAEASKLRRQLMESDGKSDKMKDRIAELEQSVQKDTQQLVDLHKVMERQAAELTTREAQANELDNELRRAKSGSQAMSARLIATQEALKKALDHREQSDKAPATSCDIPLPIHDNSQASESASIVGYFDSAGYGPNEDLASPVMYDELSISVGAGGFASLLARTGSFLALVLGSLIQAMWLTADSMAVNVDHGEEARGTDSNDGMPKLDLTQLTSVLSSIGTGVSTAFESMWQAISSVADSMMIDYDDVVDRTDSAIPVRANVPALATIILIVFAVFIVLSIPLLPSTFGLRPAQVATEIGGDMLRRIQISIRQGGGSGQRIPRWFWDDPLLDPMPGLYSI